MKIKTTQHCMHEWTAIDEDTYDGPESHMGIGNTEQEAIEDLFDKMGWPVAPIEKDRTGDYFDEEMWRDHGGK